MKKIGLILFALMLMSVGAVAQQNAGGRERRAPRMDKATMVKRMTDNQVKRLKLTKEQTEQMNVLNEAYVTEMMAQGPQRNDSIPRREMSREERDAQRKAREARMNEMRNNYVTLAKAILTPEQFKEFEKMQKERPQGPLLRLDCSVGLKAKWMVPKTINWLTMILWLTPAATCPCPLRNRKDVLTNG